MTKPKLMLGDCLEKMKSIPSASVDLVLADPPYGTTQCKWDSVIPLESLWPELKRIVVSQGVIALTASQPFSATLVCSNLSMFKHEWIWIKNRGSNFANTVREPMKEHESVLIFSKGRWTYNKQMQPRAELGLSRAKYKVQHSNQYREGTRKFEGREHHTISSLRVPSSWQKFNTEVGLHPTQKPVALMEYLTKTYTNKGDTVLDFVMGSGTTGVACRNLNRKFIGIELDPEYFKLAKDRINKTGAHA